MSTERGSSLPKCLDKIAQKRFKGSGFISTPLVLKSRGFGDGRCMKAPTKVNIFKPYWRD